MIIILLHLTKQITKTATSVKKVRSGATVGGIHVWRIFMETFVIRMVQQIRMAGTSIVMDRSVIIRMQVKMLLKHVGHVEKIMNKTTWGDQTNL